MTGLLPWLVFLSTVSAYPAHDGAATAAISLSQSLRGGDKKLESVRDFLAKTYPGKKWQTGPTQLTSDEIKKAYGEKLTFAYVFSAPPLPPGAKLPDLIKAYQDKLKDYQQNYISVSLRIDAAGKITPLNKTSDYAEGLIAAKTDDDLKAVAAAVLSLYHSGRVGPAAVKASEVQVKKDGNGWACTVTRQNNFSGTMHFNADGQVTKISKVSIAPLPP
jgi:hypothetical protein